MTLNRVQALRTQRQQVLDYCADLSDDDWTAPSQAAGWRVRDVIAHMGGTCRGLFGKHAITLVFSDDTEQTNEDLLARPAPGRPIAYSTNSPSGVGHSSRRHRWLTNL
jgi:uncharacterized protein (TIGR03083 family)